MRIQILMELSILIEFDNAVELLHADRRAFCSPLNGLLCLKGTAECTRIDSIDPKTPIKQMQFLMENKNLQSRTSIAPCAPSYIA